VTVRAVAVRHNANLNDGDGLTTGLAALAPELWRRARAAPDEIDVFSVYDDYPVMALVRLADLGFGDPRDVLAALHASRVPVYTSGGQLSAGQAGAAGGMHGLVEVVEQLRGRAGGRHVDGARRGVVTGYGTVAYRYGAGSCVLEAA
jgi:acetyl-CoA acetyltransferase